MSFEQLEASSRGESLEGGSEYKATSTTTQTREMEEDTPSFQVESQKPKREAKKKEAESDDSESKDKEVQKESLRKQAKEARFSKGRKKDKIVTVKLGEEDVSLPHSVEVPIEVNGEVTNVPLSSLLGAYKADKDIQRRFSEVDRERKAFEADRNTLQDMVTNLHKRMTDPEASATAAIEYIAECVGADPIKIASEFRQKVFKDMERFKEMTPEQIEAEEARAELEMLRRQREDTRTQEMRQKELSALESRVDAVQQKYAINAEKMTELYQDLLTAGVPQDKITPESLGEYHQELSARQSAQEVLREVNPDMSEEALDGAIEEFAGLVLDKGFTVDDLKEIAVEVYGNKAAKNLSRKVRKAEPAATAKVSGERATVPVNFDDI